MRYFIQIKIFIFLLIIHTSCARVGSFQLYSFEFETMCPNFVPGDMVIVDRRINTFTYGDVSVYYYGEYWDIEDAVFAWRIAGLPGDSISVRNDICVINGKINSHRKVNDSIFFVDQNWYGEYQKIFPNGVWYDEYQEIFPNGVNISILHSPPLSELYYKEQIEFIPEDHYYFLGDLRSNSFDSRELGALPGSSVEGKVVKVITNKKGLSARWELFKYALWGYKKEN